MSDYSGEVVEVEVARYGLRTFRFIQAYEAAINVEWLRMQQYLLTGLFLDTPQRQSEPAGPMELCSTSMSGSHWKHGVCEATCRVPQNAHQNLLIELAALTTGTEPVYGHQAPQEDCHCGIYAAHTLGVLTDQFPQYVCDIVTVVAAEGQTIIGSKGFRTQRARVVAYWCSDRVAPTAKTQFAEAQRLSDIPSMLTEYGLKAGHPPVERSRAAGLVPMSSVPGGMWTLTTHGVGGGGGGGYAVPYFHYSDRVSEPAEKRRCNKKAVGVNLAASAANSTLFVLSNSWWCLAGAVVSLLAGFYFLVVAA